MAKASHDAVSYTDDALEAPRMDRDDECSNCIHFCARDRNSDCELVQSPINPQGWCDWYEEVNDLYVKDRE